MYTLSHHCSQFRLGQFFFHPPLLFCCVWPQCTYFLIDLNCDNAGCKVMLRLSSLYYFLFNKLQYRCQLLIYYIFSSNCCTKHPTPVTCATASQHFLDALSPVELQLIHMQAQDSCLIVISESLNSPFSSTAIIYYIHCQCRVHLQMELEHS